MWHTPRFRRRSTVFRLERLEERTVLSTLTVLNSLDSGAGSLRDTIAAASPGDTINFDKSVKTITLSTELVINLTPGQAPLDIEGPGPKKLKISGNDASRVFDITGGTVTIAGLTIADGVTDGKTLDSPGLGGGILNLGDLTLSNDVLSNNQALGQISVSNPLGRAIGGGVANLGPTLNVTACQFINNQARGADFSSGGGQGTLAGSGASGAIGNPPSLISGVTDRVSVTDSLFAGNVARGGSGWTGMNAGTGLGGSISNGGNLIVTYSIFTANQAIGGNDNTGSDAGGGVGGAISSGAFTGVQSLVVRGSIFDGNQAVGGNGNEGDRPNIGAGGAISVLNWSGNISNCTLDHNLALGGQGAAGSSGGDGLGGGIANFFGEPKLTVTSTTVDHNMARGGHGGAGGNGGDGLGGGLYNGPSSTLTLTGVTVEYNLALGGFTLLGTGGDGLGGGLYNGAGSSLVLSSATVKDNFALGGFGLAGFGQGIGGGVYTLVTFSSDSSTVIKKNHASTSNDDIFP